MVGLTEQGIRSYMPEHLHGIALRLHGLGYEVNYRKLSPNPKKSRKSPREFVEAENANFTQLRLTITWTQAQGPLIRMEGSVRNSRGDQAKLFEIRDMDSFWAFAESGRRLPGAGV